MGGKSGWHASPSRRRELERAHAELRRIMRQTTRAAAAAARPPPASMRAGAARGAARTACDVIATLKPMARHRAAGTLRSRGALDADVKNQRSARQFGSSIRDRFYIISSPIRYGASMGLAARVAFRSPPRLLRSSRALRFTACRHQRGEHQDAAPTGRLIARRPIADCLEFRDDAARLTSPCSTM